MKKLLLFLFSLFALSACSTDDSQADVPVHYELLPIQYCQLPRSFTSGTTYEFEMFYKMPTTCHTYIGILLDGEDSTKKIAIQTRVAERNDCQPITYTTVSGPGPDLASAKFNFIAGDTGTIYTFKMWTGKNENGEDTYYDYVVPVR